MSLAVLCNSCGRIIHSTALSGTCAACLLQSTRSNLGKVEDFSPGEELFPGRLVGPRDRFLLLKKIGHGGMGEIWLANDEHLSRGGETRPVALKFLSEEIRTNERALQLLREEVARSQTLNHPNIVRIHDLHDTADGTPFIKMEYVEGDSLAHWLRASGEPMPWRMACELCAQVASALDYAHQSARLVHRDVKPANILIGKGPSAKLTDFGIAQAVQEADDGVEHEPMGTLAYASPEQIQGRPPSPSDDVYALGATLYELLTGTAPSESTTTEALRAHTIYSIAENVNARLERLGHHHRVPSDLAALVSRCLQKHAADRPPMKKVAAMLGQLINATEDEAPKVEKRSWIQPIAVAACVAITGWAIYHYDLVQMVRGKTRQPPESSIRAEQPAESEQPDRSSAAEETPPPSNPVASKAAPPLAPAVSPAELATEGWISVVMHSLDFRRRTVRVFRDEELIEERSFPPARRHDFTLTSTSPGARRIVVSQEGYATNAVREIQLRPGETNQAIVFFGTKDIALESQPPGATVRWTPAYFGNSTVANRGTRKFEAEIPYLFEFELAGYKTHRTNVIFHSYGRGLVTANLTAKVAPEFGPGSAGMWTNAAIGMIFRRIGPLFVCTTETTVEQYRKFVTATGRHDTTNGMYSITFEGRKQAGFSWSNPGFAQTDRHPAIGVSEADARAFCDWLTQSPDGLLDPGQAYRLPTAQEWREFSGAGKYPWGDSPEIDGNFSGVEVLLQREQMRWPNSFPHLKPYEDKWGRTAPVQAGPVSATGLYFIAGNVAERCQGGMALGGSWFDGETLDHRNTLDTLTTRDLERSSTADDRDDRIGFRVVLAQGRSSR